MKKIEVAELSRVNRVTHRMQKGSRLAMFQQHQCFHDAVQENQRRAREAGKSAEKSSAQLENGLMWIFGRLMSTTSRVWRYENGKPRIDSQVKL